MQEKSGHTPDERWSIASGEYWRPERRTDSLTDFRTEIVIPTIDLPDP